MANGQEGAAPNFPISCFPNRSSANIPEAIQNAESSIDILQMDLESVRSELISPIRHALKSQPGMRVRILTLDPNSAYIAGRGHQLGIRLNQHRDELHRGIREIASAFSEFPSQFSLRVYNEYPTQITFRVDDTIFVATIARNHRSRELCTFKLDVGITDVQRSFVSHFETIWEISTEYQ